MGRFLSSPACRMVCWYLILVLSGIVLAPGTARAAFISPSEGELEGLDGEILSTVRLALENDLLTERLARLGLSPEEIRTRIDSLSPEERQAVLEDVEGIQAGGDGVGGLVSLALLILIVILIIKLLDKEIIIR